MMFGLGNRVANTQKVADNPKPTDPKKSFTVAWNKHESLIGEVVGITATAHINIVNMKGLTVEILSAPNKVYMTAENITVKDRKITATWKVKPESTANIDKQTYHARVSYNGGMTGETSQGLKVKLLGNPDEFKAASKKKPLVSF